MQRVLRTSAFVVASIAVLLTVATVVLYALSFNSLGRSGPNVDGYNFLLAANSVVPWIAVLVVLAVIAAFARRSVVVATASLALASGIVGGILVALRSISIFLSQVDQHSQPPALNSLILAVAGSAQTLAPTAVILAVGAALLAGIALLVTAQARSNRTSVVATG
jgi:hypothetical protein